MENKLNWQEWKTSALIAGGFLAFYFLPAGAARFDNAVLEALYLVRWYAREHVLFCLIPAFYIAGAIGLFVSRATVMSYLGAGANRVLAYGAAAVSGCVLTVCSCTVLPIFAGIYRMGAGLGPAAAFLYAGPAINAAAIILTARVLGVELAAARALGAVLFSVIIGVLMELIFRKKTEAETAVLMPEEEAKRPLWQNGLYFTAMLGILIFANWGAPDAAAGFGAGVFALKWQLTGLMAAFLGLMLIFWFGLNWWKVLLAALPALVLAVLMPERPTVVFAAGLLGFTVVIGTDGGEGAEWLSSSWGFAKQLAPLLLGGILIAGALLGRPGGEGLIPAGWISRAVGGNSLSANFSASVIGAFMYFATLTEVPILQGLLGNGMGKGPALALLLAGPALSLPNMLVISSVLGWRKTLVFIVLVVVMAAFSGVVYGTLFSAF
ncbi:MAG: hypothetical protein B0D92_01440 [Spirochaeta sp. LUC14_002_19_P3]|nr:MAG: hypothetical protein B0D92_01440 [Spirochaeta sp. LUC14_002_19_P3]